MGRWRRARSEGPLRPGSACNQPTGAQAALPLSSLDPSSRECHVSEAVCKPSSVPPRAEARVGDGHPSVAAGHPTALAAYPRAGQRTSPPNRSPGTGCALLFGLAPGGVCRVSLRRPTRKPVGGIVTVALFLVSRRTGVTRHPALRSSDFPHETRRIAPTVPRDHPTASLTDHSTAQGLGSRPGLSRPAFSWFDGRPTPDRRRGPDRSLGSPAHPRRCSAPSGRARPTSARNRRASAGRAPRAG